jgi:hypothetical protein
MTQRPCDVENPYQIQVHDKHRTDGPPFGRISPRTHPDMLRYSNRTARGVSSLRNAVSDQITPQPISVTAKAVSSLSQRFFRSH